MPAALTDDIMRRDQVLLAAVRAGDVVAEWTTIRLSDRLEVEVSRDALRWQLGDKLVRLGVSAYIQQQIADSLGAVLLTPLLCDLRAREARAAGGLVGPFPQSGCPTTTRAYVQHSGEIDEALPATEPGMVAGWKDWCLTLDSWRKPGMATNYGFPVPAGEVRSGRWRGIPVRRSVSGDPPWLIQLDHEAHGAGRNTDDDPEPEIPGHGDYSQLVALGRRAWVDGIAVPLGEVYMGLHGADLAALVSHEGPLPGHRLPGVPLLGLSGPETGRVDETTNEAGEVMIPPDSEPGAEHCAEIGGALASLAASSAATAGVAAVASAAAREALETAATSPIPPPPDTQPCGPPNDLELRSLSTVDRVRLFGAFDFRPAPTAGDKERIVILDDWPDQNIVRVVIPQLAEIPGVVWRGQRAGRGPQAGATYCHRLIADQLRALWTEWERAGLLELVITWGGLWVPRLMRGSRTTLSAHAWGTAFDINVPWNLLGRTPAAAGTRGSVRALVPLAEDHGFYWGGNFSSRPDGMHFEAAEVL